MVYIETTTLSKTVFKTTVWKSYIHNIFSLWHMSKPDIEALIEQANLHHQLLNSRPKLQLFFKEPPIISLQIKQGK